ncbi:cell division protein CrgA [Arcanobacterium hippocoleae]|uniref:Cell division protein CrgA n=1 Tax=Arcanobacterium hippocoleae TaxID=149017 RepID=A0ABU1T2E3_9ACTO|nr:cell division protein CrgA [Arcanobacterium hippocoleae]MDR6939547.1 putative membrane protein [Arcanobacterium hippocoleae]
MPESKKRKKVVAAEKIKARRTTETQHTQLPAQSPRWWAPVMVAFAIIGLLVIVTAYVTNGAWPIPGLTNGNINLFVGIGLMLVGFLMTMGWK